MTRWHHMGSHEDSIYAPGSYTNLVTQKEKYRKFCQLFDLHMSPASEWQLIRFSVYLSFIFKSPNSVQNYVGAVCILQEVNGFTPIKIGKWYHNVINGIKRKMQHETRQAKAVTINLLPGFPHFRTNKFPWLFQYLFLCFNFSKYGLHLPLGHCITNRVTYSC